MWESSGGWGRPRGMLSVLLGPWQDSTAAGGRGRWGCRLSSAEHPLGLAACRPRGDREAGRETRG